MSFINIEACNLVIYKTYHQYIEKLFNSFHLIYHLIFHIIYLCIVPFILWDSCDDTHTHLYIYICKDNGT